MSGVDSQTLPNTNTAFCPPNPKAFEMAARKPEDEDLSKAPIHDCIGDPLALAWRKAGVRVRAFTLSTRFWECPI